MYRQLLAATTLVVLSLTAESARASLVELAVTYSDPEVVSGPLSFGLDALPATVTSHFTFNTDDVSIDPTTGVGTVALQDIRSSRVTFGDGVWTSLASLNVSYAEVEGAPVFLGLSYTFNPITTLTAASGIIGNSNFVLHSSGTDIATGESFQYRYNLSNPTLEPASAVPEPVTWALTTLGLTAAGAMLRRRRIQGLPTNAARNC